MGELESTSIEIADPEELNISEITDKNIALEVAKNNVTSLIENS